MADELEAQADKAIMAAAAQHSLARNPQGRGRLERLALATAFMLPFCVSHPGTGRLRNSPALP
jgi:hypothetical protein